MKCTKGHEMRDLGLWPLFPPKAKDSALVVNRFHCPTCGEYHANDTPMIAKQTSPTEWEIVP